MNLTNRLHSRTRWPANPGHRLRLADTDLDFYKVYGQMFGVTPQLLTDIDRAFRIAVEAEAERARRKAR